MSAALQFPTIARAADAQRQWQAARHSQAQPEPEREPLTPPPQAPPARFGPARSYRPGTYRPASPPPVSDFAQSGYDPCGRPSPPPSLAFYRKHTEMLLRRYLYASILVGRTPSMLTDPIVRGWASNRPVETFEDCVIFVLDMERSFALISALDRLLITRIVLQEYSVPETALMLNKSQRLIGLRLADALDRLTRILLDNRTLRVPKPRQLQDDPQLVP